MVICSKVFVNAVLLTLSMALSLFTLSIVRERIIAQLVLPYDRLYHPMPSIILNSTYTKSKPIC